MALYRRIKALDLKRIVTILFDMALVATGIILTPIGAIKWKDTGFDNKIKGEIGNNDGNEAIMIIIIGFAAIAYGLIPESCT
jgi:hypothetical protein